MDISQLVPAKTIVATSQRMPVRGVVSTPPLTVYSPTMRVVAPGHSQDYDMECRWMPRGTALPIVGADCLVVFDEVGAGYVTWWANTTRAWNLFHRIAVALSPAQTSPQVTASRFDAVICQMNASNRAWMGALKGYNPKVLALGYQETPYTRYLDVSANGYSSDCAAGVSEEQTAANPTWYEKTAGNAFITNPVVQIPDRLLNVGLSAVRTAWKTNAIARAHAGAASFDGIFGDDTNYHLGTAGTPADYANDAAWWTAQSGMYQTIYPDFVAAGLHLIPNLGAWQSNTQAWDNSHGTDNVGNILPYVDGAMEEFFVMYANGSLSGYYHNDLGAMERCVAAGKRYYAQVHGTATTARYGFATLLIGAHATDRTLQSIGYSSTGQDYVNEYWLPEFDYAIGAPVEAKVEIGGNAVGFNAFRRYYSNGVALVNPAYNIDGSARSSSVAFALNAKYTGSGIAATNSVTLAAGTGAVMVLTA
jgi:hypothetical protein